MGAYLAKRSWPILILIGFVATFSLKFDAVGVTFFLSAAQSALLLGIASARPASLLLMYWMFTVSFLGLIPWLHHSNGETIWRGAPLDETTLFDVNLLIIVANFSTFLAHQITFRSTRKKTTDEPPIRNMRISAIVLLLISAAGFAGVLLVNGFNIRLILFRGVVDQTRDALSGSSAINLIISMVSRMTPVFSFYIAYTRLRKHFITKTLLLVLLILSVFPTGVPRYFVAYAYIPLLLMMAPMLRSGATFSAVFLFSLLFVFPLLDQFRTFSGFDSISLTPSREFFFLGHFDAFENLGSAVESNFISNGYQLLGALLFFVPRSIWPDKPVGSGYEMANQQGYVFNNISMPFLGEGFVNFGYLGVVLFAIVIGIIMGYLDKARAPRNIKGRIGYQNSVYYFLFGGIFFISRGDLLSSFAYLSASLFVAWLVGAIINFVNTRPIR